MPSRSAAARRARISACAVGSWRCSRSLWPAPITAPSCTTTAPTGHVVVRERALGLADREAHEARRPSGRDLSRSSGLLWKLLGVRQCSVGCRSGPRPRRTHDDPPLPPLRRPRARAPRARRRGRPSTCPARSSSATRRAAGAAAAPRRVRSGPRTRVVRLRAGETVAGRIAQLRAPQPGVLSATPNYIARASYIPNDPGRDGGRPAAGSRSSGTSPGRSGSTRRPPGTTSRAPGGSAASGVTVAVLDTGVAYSDHGRITRSPDLRGNRFVRGYDFVDDDRTPHDENGHGTHVASTIAESNDNGIGVTGLAFGAKIMPVRVLDRWGEGDSVAIARGIRFADQARRRHHQPVVRVRRRRDRAPDPGHPRRARLRPRPRHARRRRVGQRRRARRVAYPARAPDVLVGRRDDGARLPRRVLQQGPDARPRGARAAARTPTLAGDPNCRPLEPSGGDIYQMTFRPRTGRFGLPGRLHRAPRWRRRTSPAPRR